MTSYACQFGKNHQTPLVPLPTRAALLERNVQPCPWRRGGGRCGSCWDCLLPHEASPGQPTDRGTHTHMPPNVIPSGPGTCPGTTAAPHRKPVPRPKNSDFPPLPRPRSRPAQVSLPDEAGPPVSEGQPEMTAEHTLSRRPTEHPRLPTVNAGQAFSLCHHGPKDGTRDSLGGIVPAMSHRRATESSGGFPKSHSWEAAGPGSQLRHPDPAPLSAV